MNIDLAKATVRKIHDEIHHEIMNYCDLDKETQEILFPIIYNALREDKVLAWMARICVCGDGK